MCSRLHAMPQIFKNHLKSLTNLFFFFYFIPKFVLPKRPKVATPSDNLERLRLERYSSIECPTRRCSFQSVQTLTYNGHCGWRPPCAHLNYAFTSSSSNRVVTEQSNQGVAGCSSWHNACHTILGSCFQKPKRQTGILKKACGFHYNTQETRCWLQIMCRVLEMACPVTVSTKAAGGASNSQKNHSLPSSSTCSLVCLHSHNFSLSGTKYIFAMLSTDTG